MDPISFDVLLILVFVALSALFSGMETALVSLSEVKLRARVEAGEKMPRLLRLWVEQPNDVLAALLIGNNLVNISASALATSVTQKLLSGTPYEGWGIPVAVFVMTLAILIFGEVAPKTYAKHQPERYAKLLPILNPIYAISSPFRRVLVGLTRHVVLGFGGSVESDRATVTEEDIEEMVRVGRLEGSIAPEATELLTGVLELDEKVAREIMVPRTDVHAIQVDASLEEIAVEVTESAYSRYPVYRSSLDDVVGVLYVKDLLAAVLRTGGERPELVQIMRPPMIVPENMSVPDLLVAMKRERVHMAVVASEYGGVRGIVSLEDIVEEVFGDIYDEHDQDEETIRPTGDGTWVVEGVVTLDDLEDTVGVRLSLEDEDYETVAGLLMKAAGRVPEAGFVHALDQLEFEVLRTDATRLLEVAVRRLPEPREGDEEGDEDEGEEAPPRRRARAT